MSHTDYGCVPTRPVCPSSVCWPSSRDSVQAGASRLIWDLLSRAGAEQGVQGAPPEQTLTLDTATRSLQRDTFVSALIQFNTLIQLLLNVSTLNYCLMILILTQCIYFLLLLRTDSQCLAQHTGFCIITGEVKKNVFSSVTSVSSYRLTEIF